MPSSAPQFSDNRAGINALPLSDLLQYIQGTLKNAYRDSFWIIAEVTSVSRSNGHYYFDLAEMKDGQVVAKCRATLWSFLAERIIPYFQKVTGDLPKIGMELMLQVKVEFHLQYGFSLNIQNINPEHTLGNLERQKQETISRLQAEGVFDLNKYFILPRLVQRIAVISSETAAGWGDFHDQIRKNMVSPLIRLDLYPALMQGAGTTRSIYEAMLRIQERQADYDTVIILRGGGSRMDLSAFDDYNLCVLIANFPMPIITAIGHERDISVADMVANTYVKTPTAAAEFILRRLEVELYGTLSFEQRLSILLTENLRSKEQQYTQMVGRVRQLLMTLEREQSQRLNQYAQNTVSVVTSVHASCRSILTPLSSQLNSALQNIMQREQKKRVNSLGRTAQILRQTTLRAQHGQMKTNHQSERLSLHLERLLPESEKSLRRYEQLISIYDPTSIIKRGFLPVLHNGRQITNCETISLGDELKILLPDGEVSASVTLISPNTPLKNI